MNTMEQAKIDTEKAIGVVKDYFMFGNLLPSVYLIIIRRM